jgi:Ca2+-binding RTX toxin-like protein
MKKINFRGFDCTVKPGTVGGKPIKGTPGNDWLEVMGNNLRVTSGAGDDVILANVGTILETVADYPPYRGQAIFYDGVPTSAKTVGTSWIDAGAGNDYVAVVNGNYVIDLGGGNNVFDGGVSTGKIRVSAGHGDDIIDAGGIGGERYINAGGGNNWIYLASGKAFVSAGAGDDLVTTVETELQSGTGVLKEYLGLGVFPEYAGVTGKPYKQSIDVGNGNNQIALLVFGETDVKTGSGNDFVLLGSVTRGILRGAVNEDSVNIFTDGGNDTVVTISTKSLIKTGSGDDLVFGGAGDDTIYAGSGDDVINLRGATVQLPQPLGSLSFLGDSVKLPGGGNDTVDLGKGKDTVILGNAGFARIQGFGRDDRLDVTGLNASFTHSGGNTLISAGGNAIGILQGYTGPIGLV